MNQNKDFILGTHVWQLQSKQKQFLLGTGVWQLINKETSFKSDLAPYPQMAFLYLLERGAFLKKYETRIIELKEKINSLLMERIRSYGG